MNKKKIVITIDPGFHSFKLTINKKNFSVVSNVSKGKSQAIQMLMGSSNDNIILKSNEESYLMGTLALNFQTSKKIVQEYDAKRFLTDDFNESLIGILGYTLYMYAQDNDENFTLDKIDDYDIYCGVSFPHTALKEYANTVLDRLAGNHKFTMDIGNEKNLKFDLSIRKNNLFATSQIISAIMGELLDDNGIPNMDDKNPLHDLPTVVIDGGYYTFGIVDVGTGYLIVEDDAESNTNFAMYNVNKNVRERIKREFERDLTESEIEKALAHGDFEQQYNKNNTFGTFDLNEIKEQELDAIVEKVVAYLDSKYDKMLSKKNILVTGGTGAAYHKRLLETYCKVRKQFTPEHVILTKPVFNGKELDPVFAITVGTYKAIIAQINLMGQPA